MTGSDGDVTAIILSGGRGRRFDHQDKGLLTWHGRPLVSHVVGCILPQVDDLVISSNRNEEEYRALGHRILSDTDADFQGPIAGMLAGLEQCKTRYALVCPCDTPKLPANLVARLRKGLGDADVAVVHDGERRQNLVALMKMTVLPSLQAYYDDGGRAVRNWYPSVIVADVDFSKQAKCFFNINRPEDL